MNDSGANDSSLRDLLDELEEHLVKVQADLARIGRDLIEIDRRTQALGAFLEGREQVQEPGEPDGCTMK